MADDVKLEDEKGDEQKGDEQKTEDPLVTVRDQMAEIVGLDPDSATNDPDLLAAWTDYHNDLEASIQAAAQKRADTPEYADAIRAQLVNDIDIEQAAAEVLVRQDERQKARRKSVQQDVERKGTESAEEATKASGDIVERVRAAQTKALSGVTAMALDRKLPLDQILQRPVGEEDPLRLLQEANDEAVFLRDILRVGEKHSMYTDVTELDVWPKFAETFAELGKALDTVDASTWVPGQYSDVMIMNVFQTTDIAGLFPRFPWPAGGGATLIKLAEGSEPSTKEAGEATTDDSDPAFTATDIGLGTNVTITPRTFAQRMVWSYEIEEDAIIDIVGHLRMKFVRAFARDLDMALLDGDADGTHQDTGYSMADNDVRELFNGLRRQALSDSPTSAAVYQNAEKFMEPLLNMGAYGQPATSVSADGPLDSNGTVGICSHGTRLIMGFLRDTKGERIGGSASALSGPISNLMGWPIVASEKVLSDLTTAGIYDGATETHTYFIWVYTPAWEIHTKADLTVRIGDREEYGQRYMTGRQRLAFQRVYGSSETTTRMVYAFVDTAFP